MFIQTTGSACHASKKMGLVIPYWAPVPNTSMTTQSPAVTSNVTGCV